MQTPKTLLLVTLAAVTVLLMPNHAEAASSIASPAQTRAVLANADRAVSRGDADHALTILTRHHGLLVRSGADAERASIACQAHFMKADFVQAVEQCSIAIDSRNAHWSDFNNRGAARLHSGDWSGAMADFTTARAMNPASVEVRKNLTHTRAALKAAN
ncbi:MAG: hypothetical protein AAGJ86_13320 [Pseudomonadota bacterium]